jgi:type IV pilus assembly protein PilW
MAIAHLNRLFGAHEENAQRGFSLIELLVAMVVALVAIAAVYSVYAVQQRENRNQRLKLAAQQNLRSALVVLEQEIRMAGFDPQDTGLFGITDIRRYDVIGTGLDPQGQPAIFYTVDWNENGLLEPNEFYGLRIRDDRKLGRTYLTMSIGGSGRQRLAENIEAWGLAYAVDVDRNGLLDTWQGGSHLIWAVDSDNDNFLDSHLDTNNDGKIDLSDDADGDQVISAADGAPLNPPIPVDRIKAVRIWLLVVTEHPLQNHYDSRPLMVGDRIILPPNDGFQRRVMEIIIECRNL